MHRLFFWSLLCSLPGNAHGELVCLRDVCHITIPASATDENPLCFVNFVTEQAAFRFSTIFRDNKYLGSFKTRQFKVALTMTPLQRLEKSVRWALRFGKNSKDARQANTAQQLIQDRAICPSLSAEQPPLSWPPEFPAKSHFFSLSQNVT